MLDGWIDGLIFCSLFYLRYIRLSMYFFYMSAVAYSRSYHHHLIYDFYRYHHHHIDKDFVDYFSKWGIVKDAVVMIDKNTYASRGFGFVTFELESSVDKVLREGHAIKGKYIECKRAEPKGFYGGGPSDGGMYVLSVCMVVNVNVIRDNDCYDHQEEDDGHDDDGL